MKKLLFIFFLLFEFAGFGQTPELIKVFAHATGSSNPSNFVSCNGLLFFTYNDGANGTELWKSDGTLAGTVMVSNIRNGSASSDPSNFLPIGNILYFSANDGINGQELWRSDGTVEGTYMLKDINPGGSSQPINFYNANGTLYFQANDG